MYFDPVRISPRVERPADELRAVVGDQPRRCPARFDEALQHLGNAATTDRGVDVDRKTRTGEVVDHREDAKASAIIEHIEDEIERPAFIDAWRRRQSWHTARHSPTPIATADGQAFLRVKAIDALEVHETALN